MVKAVKGRPITHPFHFKVGGQLRRFDQKNIEEFVERVPRALAKMLKRHVSGSATIVPIPNSHVTDVDDDGFRTLEIAEKIAESSGGQFSTVPALIFSEPQRKSSSQGGSRDPSHFQKVYRITTQLRGPIILFDDVCTSGAHLIGAYRRLHFPPRCSIAIACSFGRSTKVQLPAPVGEHQETLPFF
jgi:hypothetical protein